MKKRSRKPRDIDIHNLQFQMDDHCLCLIWNNMDEKKLGSLSIKKLIKYLEKCREYLEQEAGKK